VSTVRDSSPPVKGVEARAAPQRDMAHPDPKVAEASRRMAHPVRWGRLRALLALVRTHLPDSAGEGGAGDAGSVDEVVVPARRRYRDLVLVLVFLAAATAVTASVPGGWANPSGAAPPTRLAGQSPSPSAANIAWQAAPTVYVQPTIPDTRLTPTLPPTPKPTPAPTKAPHIYTFVALGDSLTSGYGDPGPAWPERLDTEDANLRLLHNAGVPGNVTSQMLDRENSDVFSFNPEVMFLLGGTNDLGKNVSLATAIANLRAIIVAARAKGIHIFMLNLPPNSYQGMADQINSWNAAILHLANSYTIVMIDIRAVLSTSTGVYNPKYTVDGLHFNAAGAQLVANTIYARIHRSGY
jgi:lysophospholipase L1-like esterase